MTIVLQLPDDLERVLRARAALSGHDVRDFILVSLRERFDESASLSLAAECGTGNGTELEADEDAAPWRGVFVLDYHRPELFQRELNVRTADLPRWQPQVVIDERHSEGSDE